MNEMNEWGLSQVTPPATTSTLSTGVGLFGGALVGGIVGALVAPSLAAIGIGVGTGAVAGGVLGNYAGKSAAAAPAAAPPFGTLPPGPYTLLPNGSSLQPGGTYLISRGTQGVSNLQATLQEVESELSPLTVLGSWIGIPPSGWPPNDQNAAAGIFVAVKNNTASVATDLNTEISVFATGKATE